MRVTLWEGHILRRQVQALARINTFVVYGDNLEHSGYGGQAYECRGEPNTFGIPTKKAAYRSDFAFFNDNELDSNTAAIDRAVEAIYDKLKQDPTSKVVILPGIGEGLAELRTRAPRTFDHLRLRLLNLVRADGDASSYNALYSQGYNDAQREHP